MSKSEELSKIDDVFYGIDFPDAAAMLAAMLEYERKKTEELKNTSVETPIVPTTTYDNW